MENYADIIFVNEAEAEAFVKKNPHDAAVELSKFCDIAVAKLGEKGSIIQQKNTQLRINPVPANAIDTTGAGDIYAAAILYGLSQGADLERSANLGSYIASIVVAKLGARLDGSREGDARRILYGS